MLRTVFLSALLMCGMFFGSPVFSQTILSSPETAYVMYVLDGDTIVVRMGKRFEKVRFIGVDTPEFPGPKARVAQCYAKEAKHFLERLVLHRNVEMRRDIKSVNRDSIGRLVRYVSIPNTRLMLNGLLVSEGYGKVYKRSTTMLAKTLDFKEYDAKQEKKGLWNPANCKNALVAKGGI